ncbi:MAG TPA: hypothetical protein VFP05_05780 [Thermomicrobiales bacterium]|jgi:hypothetical protein|nr:hypothetical protein [Thermomicrobiales bacterium]
MRRTLLALVLVCGFGLPLAMFSNAHAEDVAAAPIVVTVHLASCSIDEVNSDLGFYDACHANGIGGETITLASAESVPVLFVTDDSGVGAGQVNGQASISQVTLTADPGLTGATDSYAYCADQVDGSVLFDSKVAPGGSIPLFTVTSSQTIICDWFIYTDTVVAVG